MTGGRAIVLASNSPRRQALLREAGIRYTCRPPAVDDGALDPGGVSAAQWAMAMAYLKARSAADGLRRDEPGAELTVLAADTVCEQDDLIIGQPADRAAAQEMLGRLSGREHHTITGVCLLELPSGRRRLLVDTATVRVGPLTAEQISGYLDSGLWQGKAGGYNLAERLEAGWPMTCDGDPGTVMGLPVRRLPALLEGPGVAPAGGPPPHGPVPPALASLTAPAAWLYGRIIARRNRRFDRGVGVVQVPVPVISVGNITTGGTGKTPVVSWIADLLLAAGHRPVIAMRGYGATAERPADEQAEHEQRLPGVPVVAQPDRHAALSAFLPDHPEIDCVVLDDGFQHRRLNRDLDLVLVDATAGTMRDRLLPRGNLREPTASLRRADAVIVTHASSVDPALAGTVAALHGREPLAWCRPVWTALRVMDENGERAGDPTWLSGRRVLTLLGVARPERVRRQLEAAGALIAADVPARDHERFDVAKLTVARGLCDGVDAMVMTGKDWVRARDLIDLSRWPAPIVVPELRVEFLAGEGALRERILAALPRPR